MHIGFVVLRFDSEALYFVVDFGILVSNCLGWRELMGVVVDAAGRRTRRR